MKKIAILSGWTGAEIEIAKKSANFFKKYINCNFDYYELPDQLDEFIKNKALYNLALPVFHWEYWEDGRVFAFLDILWIPHTFSSYNSHAICLDKYKANTLVSDLWIKVPEQYILFKQDDFLKIPENLAFPLILKPNRGGSSFFTYKIENNSDLENTLIKARDELDDDIVLQQFVVADEYSVSVVNWEVLPIMKLEKKNKEDFFDYDSKYESEDAMKEIWPEIDRDLKEILENYTCKIYNYFELKGFSRVDFLVDWNNVFFLEVNTIPWMTEASILPKSWAKTWRNFEELVQEIIK